MIERKFVSEGVMNMKIEEYFNKELERADYSHCEIKRTPLATRVIIYAARPGIIIGRGGEAVARLQETLKEKFGLENPQIEVKTVDEPYLDARIVAKRIKFALERGMNYRRVVNMFLSRIKEAGAVGAEIEISGKLSGERKRREKFMTGYIMKCGYPALEWVDEAKEQAVLKPGVIGIKVKLMPYMPAEMELEKKIAKGEIKIKKEGEAEVEKEEKREEATEEIKEKEVDESAEAGEEIKGEAEKETEEGKQEESKKKEEKGETSESIKKSDEDKGERKDKA